MGLPLGDFLSIFVCSTSLGMLSSVIYITCPNHLHLLFCMSFSISSIPHSSLTLEINISMTLWNPEVQCHIHKGSPIIVSCIFVLIRISLRSILILSSHLYLSLPKCLFSVGWLLKVWKHSYLIPLWLHALTILIFLNTLNKLTGVESISIYIFHLMTPRIASLSADKTRTTLDFTLNIT